VGHIERFNPAVQKLKEIIKHGKLGEITSIIARRVGIFPPQIKDANVFLDLAVHDIDIFNYLLERDPREVYAKAGRALSSRREDHAVITLDYGKAACMVQVNWITPVKVRNLAVTGTKGYAELDYISQELKVFESIYERTYDSFGDFVIKFGTSKESKVDVTTEEPLKAELEGFVECVKEGKKPAVSGEDGLKAVELAILSNESYKKNMAMKYEHDKI
jgi:UDP-N-acetylglucosamine 3-dehydrogenase